MSNEIPAEPITISGDATATNAASSTRATVVGTSAARPMTEDELRELAAQEASIEAQRHAQHVAQNAAQQNTNAHLHSTLDEDELAVTGTGRGDNRDETGDPDIAAGLGGIGGALVGAAAGSMLGPAGALAGAVVGGLTVGGLSGVAVDALDKTDDDTTISGLPADESAQNINASGENTTIV